ncbi:hypothetical protein MSG28_008806 [Choristoneura fumiferana]|uniref:Uncharacterized protein n=1 Tax=Choristoneura fumiferana TaxID=7141 RepID=A0ACC0J871_CHOFU|nr:hypothetical protein MSG28_008806 [Choristoneura fumiferana]
MSESHARGGGTATTCSSTSSRAQRAQLVGQTTYLVLVDADAIRFLAKARVANHLGCDDERSEEERVRFNYDQNKHEPSERPASARIEAKIK